MYAIINWNSLEDLSPVYNQDGEMELFDTEQEANVFAEENLNFNWLVIEE